MRLLALDAGNTRIKWGLHDGRQWLQRGYTTADRITELPASLSDEPERIIASNVAGAAVANLLAATFAPRAVHTVHATGVQCGVTNHYDRAEQLGSDRWAALIAVHQLGAAKRLNASDPVARNAALVVSAGTALTVDALHEGQFLGGAIVPGYRLMRAALAQNTAQLHEQPGQFSVFPTNTADAMTSGCLLALAGCIEHLRAALQQRTQQPVTVWLNGGDSALLAPLFLQDCVVEDNLVLTGLYFIAREVFA